MRPVGLCVLQRFTLQRGRYHDRTSPRSNKKVIAIVQPVDRTHVTRLSHTVPSPPGGHPLDDVVPAHAKRHLTGADDARPVRIMVVISADPPVVPKPGDPTLDISVAPLIGMVPVDYAEINRSGIEQFAGSCAMALIGRMNSYASGSCSRSIFAYRLKSPPACAAYVPCSPFLTLPGREDSHGSTAQTSMSRRLSAKQQSAIHVIERPSATPTSTTTAPVGASSPTPCTNKRFDPSRELIDHCSLQQLQPLRQHAGGAEVVHVA